MIHRLGELLKTRGAKTRLAKKIGKSESIISDLCSGRDRLNDDLIKIISEGLGIEPWELFVDPKDAVPNEFRDVFEGYQALDPNRRMVVDDMLALAKARARAEAEAAKNPKKK